MSDEVHVGFDPGRDVTNEPNDKNVVAESFRYHHLLMVARVVDALWTEPDPGDDSNIWMTDDEDEMASALRALRVALASDRPTDEQLLAVIGEADGSAELYRALRPPASRRARTPVPTDEPTPEAGCANCGYVDGAVCGKHGPWNDPQVERLRAALEREHRTAEGIR